MPIEGDHSRDHGTLGGQTPNLGYDLPVPDVDTVIGPDGQRCARRINGMGGEFRPDLHGEEASQRAPLGPDRQIKRWEPTPWRA